MLVFLRLTARYLVMVFTGSVARSPLMDFLVTWRVFPARRSSLERLAKWARDSFTRWHASVGLGFSGRSARALCQVFKLRETRSCVQGFSTTRHVLYVRGSEVPRLAAIQRVVHVVRLAAMTGVLAS